MACSHQGESQHFVNVNGVFPFTGDGQLLAGIEYASLAFQFDIGALQKEAGRFQKSTLRSMNFSSIGWLQKDTVKQFVARPVDQLLQVEQIFSQDKLSDRPKRQAAGWIAMGEATWALAEVSAVQGEVNTLQHNQNVIAGQVTNIASRLGRDEKIFSTIHQSLNELEHENNAFATELALFGFFSPARRYVQEVDELTDGFYDLLHHKISAKLVLPEVVKTQFRGLTKRARAKNLEPIFGDWQQVYRHESAFAFEAGVLTVVHFIPLKPRHVEPLHLWTFHSGPWLANNSVLEFKPDAQVIVADENKTPVAQLTTSFLQQCRRHGAMTLCNKPLVTSRLNGTCLDLLFTSDVTSASRACSVRYLPREPVFQAVNRTSVLAFFPTLTDVIVQCPPGDRQSVLSIENMALIHTPAHCRLAAPGFGLIMGGESDLQQSVHMAVVRADAPVACPSLRLPEWTPPVPIDAEDVRRQMDTIQASNQAAHSFSLSVSVVCVMGFILLIIVLFRKKILHGLGEDATRPFVGSLPNLVDDYLRSLGCRIEQPAEQAV